MKKGHEIVKHKTYMNTPLLCWCFRDSSDIRKIAKTCDERSWGDGHDKWGGNSCNQEQLW